MVDVIREWLSRQMEEDVRLSVVRTTLPDHVLHPDPRRYHSENYLTLDFETTTIGKGLALYPDNSIVTAAWELGPGHPAMAKVSDNGRTRGHDGHRMRCVRSSEYGLGQLVREIEQADFIVAHNAKFELQWLARCGLDLTKVVVWDTMIGEYVIGGNRWVWHQLSLENSARRRIGEGKDTIISKMFKAGLCSTEIPASWLDSYCRQDVRLARKLFLAQREAMSDRLMNVMYTRCLLTPVLADIEKNGMMLDTDMVAELLLEKEREYADLQNQLEITTGGINVNSPDQLATFLYDDLGFAELKDRKGKVIQTPGGKRRTDEATISALNARSARQRTFLELYKAHKGLYNELTKYLRKFGDCCADVGGFLQASFNQTNTRTHRLSSTGLDYGTQFQNFPRAYKPMFRSRRAGWLVGEADGSQLEFRVAAHLGRDTVALGDIMGGTDIHSVTAGIIGCSRQDAKSHTFKPLYGGRSGTPNEVRYYEFFREKYRGVTETQQRWINQVLERKSLETEWGLIYYWPNTRMEKSGYVVNSTSICNYPVQAFATAEIIPIGLVYFWHYLKAMGDVRMFLVNTVHDSIIAELPEEETVLFARLAYQCMVRDTYKYLRDVYGIQLIVPLAAGVAFSTHWGDKAAKASETTYTAEESEYVIPESRRRNRSEPESMEARGYPV